MFVYYGIKSIALSYKKMSQKILHLIIVFFFKYIANGKYRYIKNKLAYFYTELLPNLEVQSESPFKDNLKITEKTEKKLKKSMMRIMKKKVKYQLI